MNLNNIVLQPEMLADLYANSLVENSATSMPVSVTPGYQGEFAKKILIVIADQNTETIDQSETDLLNGILKACSLQMKDVAVINFYDPGANTSVFRDEAKFVLLFGIDPLTFGLPINFPHFQLQSFDKRTYLFAPSLSEVGTDRTKKASLWNALKKLFGI